jgi:hypothetical protein
MDMSDDYRGESVSPHSAASSFQPSSIESNYLNYFSQSVPSYHNLPNQFQNMAMPSSPGLFPQLGSQEASFFAPTPNEASPSPMNAGAMSFEELLTMYYGNTQQVAGTPTTPPTSSSTPQAMFINSTNQVSNVPHLSSQGTRAFLYV